MRGSLAFLNQWDQILDKNLPLEEPAQMNSQLCSVRAVLPAVTLAQYVERVKPIRLDPWQHDLCARIEKAFWLGQAAKFEFELFTELTGVQFRVAPSGFKIPAVEFEQQAGKGTKAAIHAPPQFGKSVIISQAYPAWILGYDPIHRFRLATYNISHSKAFSEVILNILRSPEHAAIFTSEDSRVPARASSLKWFTNARRRVNDGQSSFTALGLQSGFVGTGADTLLMDDPYKSVEEALSEVIRDKTGRFYTDTAMPRLNDDSNVFIMFHRYHQDDIGGRALSYWDFDLWRYAAECDGVYVDDETGKIYADPIGRGEGDYLSLRKSKHYYDTQKSNPGVWYSQFQGRPTSKEGGMFDISMLEEIDERDMPPVVHECRAWDNAATEGAGAYTAGGRMGISATGELFIRHMAREQVSTAGRERLQSDTAAADGKLIPILHPQDPGSAGKDVAFQFEQRMAGYKVHTHLVSGNKEMRAYPFALSVNAGKVKIVRGDYDIKKLKGELKNFPVGTYKDQVDALSDAHNYLQSLFHRGLVIKNYVPAVHLLGWSVFIGRFGRQIPRHWEVTAGIRISQDASQPSGWAIVARAGENAHLGEALFVVASGKRRESNPASLMREMVAAADRLCEGGMNQVSYRWLSKESAEQVALASEKLNLDLHTFDGETESGIPELNWYFEQRPIEPHPFRDGQQGAPRIYVLVEDKQIDEPQDDAGQLDLRQELVSWSRNERGEPQPFGGIILDCARMMLYNFALTAAPLTRDERLDMRLPEDIRHAATFSQIGQPDFAEKYYAHKHALKQAEEAEEAEAEQDARDSRIMSRPYKRRFNR